MSIIQERIAEVLAYQHCRLTNPKADHPIFGYHAFSEDQREHLRSVMKPAAEAIAELVAPVIREARAEELLAAAGDVFDTAIPAEFARWLEARAKRITDPITGPDCRDNKHRACDGSALDEVTDWIIECQCPCHNKPN